MHRHVFIASLLVLAKTAPNLILKSINTWKKKKSILNPQTLEYQRPIENKLWQRKKKKLWVWQPCELIWNHLTARWKEKVTEIDECSHSHKHTNGKWSIHKYISMNRRWSGILEGCLRVLYLSGGEGKLLICSILVKHFTVRIYLLFICVIWKKNKQKTWLQK